jgi:RNA polymerase sigma-70 factor (sigma-E family)
VMTDEAAGFAAFVQRASRRLTGSAWLLVGDWARAEDLVQTTLSRMWPRWPTIADPDAYAYTVMVTTYLRWQRRRWTGEVPTDRLPARAVADDPFADVDVRESVRRAMAALSPQQRAVVSLRYFTDLTEAQSAAVLGCSVAAVKSRAGRALRMLRHHPALAGLLTAEVP